MLCPKSVFITGCNRGIGLELVKQFLALPSPPKHLIATCRNPDKATELTELAAQNGNLTVLKLDVADRSQFGTIRQEVEKVVEADGLNLLINNAGLLSHGSIMDVTEEKLLECRAHSVVKGGYNLYLHNEFLPLLCAAAKSSGYSEMNCSRAAVVNVSTKVASIADNGSGNHYPYRVSKIGLNMANKNMSLDKNFQDDKILCLLLHPGWVQTEMGGPNALISTEQSAKGMINVMSQAGVEQNGQFYDYAFKPIPW